MKTTYKIKQRKLGTIYVSFSAHANLRMNERKINLLDVLVTLTEQSENLILTEKKGDTLLISPEKNLSILLAVSETEKGIKYFNIITLLNHIPKTPDQQNLRFYDIAQFVCAT